MFVYIHVRARARTQRHTRALARVSTRGGQGAVVGAEGCQWMEGNGGAVREGVKPRSAARSIQPPPPHLLLLLLLLLLFRVLVRALLVSHPRPTDCHPSFLRPPSSFFLASCLYLRVIVPIQCEPMLSVSGHVGFSDDGKRWKMDCHNGRHRLCSTFDETRSASRRAVRVTKCSHHGLMFRCLCNATMLTAYLLYLNAERQSPRGHGKTENRSTRKLVPSVRIDFDQRITQRINDQGTSQRLVNEIQIRFDLHSA